MQWVKRISQKRVMGCWRWWVLGFFFFFFVHWHSQNQWLSRLFWHSVRPNLQLQEHWMVLEVGYQNSQSGYVSFSLLFSLSLYLWSMQTDTCTKPTENTSRGCWENSSTLVYNAFFFSSSPSLFRSASAAVLFYSRLPCLHFHSSGYLFIL